MIRSRLGMLVVTTGLLATSALSVAAAPKRAKTGPPSAEPREAQLAPVDPAWKERGWRAVVPHGYVIRPRISVRTRPEPVAPVAFQLHGGVRVPLIEQGPKWSKVSWTYGRTGWVKTADLEPHAAVVLIDAESGRVLRRFAAKGQWGARSDGKALWSLSDTGITRTVLDPDPRIWSYPFAKSRDGAFPSQSLWEPDRRWFVLTAADERETTIARAETASGQVQVKPGSKTGFLAGLTPDGKLIFSGHEKETDLALLFDPETGQELRRVTGTGQVVAPSGKILLHTGKELIRYDPDLRTRVSRRIDQAPETMIFSDDEQVIALNRTVEQKGGKPFCYADLYRTGKLERLTTLRLPDIIGHGTIHRLVAVPNGWWAVASGEGNVDSYLIRYDPEGEQQALWPFTVEAAVSADGRLFCLPRRGELLLVRTDTGAVRRIPYSWRRSLPRRYLPKALEGGWARLQVSSVTLRPDGKTIVLTEWLNGDPAA